MSGEAGIGITTMAIQLQAMAYAGRPFLGRATRTARSVGAYCDGNPDNVRRWTDAARRWLPEGDTGEGATLLVPPESPLMIEADGSPGKAISVLRNVSAEKDPGLVVIDGLADVLAPRHQTNEAVGGLISYVRQVIPAAATIVLTGRLQPRGQWTIGTADPADAPLLPHFTASLILTQVAGMKGALRLSARALPNATAPPSHIYLRCDEGQFMPMVFH